MRSAPICRALWSSIAVLVAAVGVVAETEWFADRWIEYLQELNKQTATANLEFPIDGRLLANLQKCEKFELNPFASADNLAPSDIEVFSEIGHLGVFCDDPSASILNHWVRGKGGNKSEIRGFLTHDVAESCVRSFATNRFATLDKFLGVFNPSLTVIASERATNMISQTRRVVSAVKSLWNWKERWKLIVIAPSPFDSELRSLEAMTTAVLEALGELFAAIPHRTLVAVIRVSETKIWQQASFGFEACEELLSKWNLHEDNLVNSWDTLEEIVAFRYRYSTFNVQVLPFMRRSLLLPNNYTLDISPLGSDCVHFSARGHSLLHLEIWNSLFQRPSERPSHWRPLLQPLVCPPQFCPYIATNNNTVFCVQPELETDIEDPNLNEDLIILTVLLFTVALCSILLAVLVMERTPTLHSTESSSYINYVQPVEV
ncbi:hypothetical protein L596_011265 [Steinernema carpocapsae]|uniref:Uncharacterized protein n=1 Tax=Steinernema carpocapsae TaxID=34508 RepID=A0A4U5NTC9_STECR|nr:hypothetical protein L596_011265 [Steinernema carpocapsae]